MYFTSRGAPPAVSREIIKLKCSTERNAETFKNASRSIRKDMQKQNLADPYDEDTKVYNRVIVDDYLSKLGMDWEEVEALLTLDDGVQAIMLKHV